MLYRFLKIWVKAGYTFYFGKIEVKGLDKVDPDKPAIFAVNHPSAFIEPTLIAVQSPFDVNFMTRGDVFVKRFKWFFEGTNQVPVFRFKDGFSSLRSNRSSFDKCHEKLLNGAKLLIFCEGSMKWIKRLRPVQQGAAKLALGTLEKNPHLPLVIHPVGVNYENPALPGSTIMLQVGPAIELGKYYDQYLDNQREAILGLTADLQQSLKKCIIHIEADEDLELFDQIWSPVVSLFQSEASQSKSGLFNYLKRTADWINELSQGDKENLNLQTEVYSKSLEAVKLSDRELVTYLNMRLIDLFWVSSIGSIFKFFYELNKLPYRLANFISRKKTPNVEFYVSVKVVLSAFLYTFFIVFLALLWSPFWHIVIFILLGWIGSRTDLKWRSIFKGILRDKELVDQTHQYRQNLIQNLAKQM